jgi:two-component system, LuxR family, response regulator FixJ
MNARPTVFVVDDDPGVLKSLRWLIESARMPVKTFPSATAFLEAYDPQEPGCLVLDMRMPHINGLELQSQLPERGIRLPVIMITAHADVPQCVQSFKFGVFDFLEKPVDDTLLLGRIESALEFDAQWRREEARRMQFASRLEMLSPREEQVRQLVAAGRTIKEIAAELGIGVQTVAKHRKRLLDKLQLNDPVELVLEMVEFRRSKQPQ